MCAVVDASEVISRGYTFQSNPDRLLDVLRDVGAHVRPGPSAVGYLGGEARCSRLYEVEGVLHDRSECARAHAGFREADQKGSGDGHEQEEDACPDANPSQTCWRCWPFVMLASWGFLLAGWGFGDIDGLEGWI